MDFTLGKYVQLLSHLLDSGYQFITFRQYCQGQRPPRYVILRHDVDLKPYKSLETAKLEHQMGIRAVYYFRAVPESWNESVIKDIAAMGHEVGYHYESLTTCHGNMEAAFDDFKRNLEALRQLTPVNTICMHGSPKSPYDSKDMWRHYDYKALGILGEPYLDTDFSHVFYLTDTGRRWDGYKVSVRDKIEGFQDLWEAEGWTFHSTSDIMDALPTGILPGQLMITTHPQRWNDFGLEWIKEFVFQNMKNVIKLFIAARH